MKEPGKLVTAREVRIWVDSKEGDEGGGFDAVSWRLCLG